jgi:hypothetical protein
VQDDATCAYDDKGDMLAGGPDASSGYSEFGYLPRRESRFVPVKLGLSYYLFNVVSVQWDGRYWEIASDGAYRFTIKKNGDATYEGSTSLPGVFSEQQAWIVKFNGKRAKDGAQIVAANSEGKGYVAFWTYPGGGFIYKITSDVDYPFGVTDSLLPS